jgi:hypothetical protein
MAGGVVAGDRHQGGLEPNELFLSSKVAASIPSISQPSLKAARGSSRLIRCGPNVPGCRPLKQIRNWPGNFRVSRGHFRDSGCERWAGRADRDTGRAFLLLRAFFRGDEGAQAPDDVETAFIDQQRYSLAHCVSGKAGLLD